VSLAVWTRSDFFARTAHSVASHGLPRAALYSPRGQWIETTGRPESCRPRRGKGALYYRRRSVPLAAIGWFGSGYWLMNGALDKELGSVCNPRTGGGVFSFSLSSRKAVAGSAGTSRISPPSAARLALGGLSRSCLCVTRAQLHLDQLARLARGGRNCLCFFVVGSHPRQRWGERSPGFCGFSSSFAGGEHGYPHSS